MKPTPAKLRIIMAQVEGSGTSETAEVRMVQELHSSCDLHLAK